MSYIHELPISGTKYPYFKMSIPDMTTVITLINTRNISGIYYINSDEWEPIHSARSAGSRLPVLILVEKRGHIVGYGLIDIKLLDKIKGITVDYIRGGIYVVKNEYIPLESYLSQQGHKMLLFKDGDRHNYTIRNIQTYR